MSVAPIMAQTGVAEPRCIGLVEDDARTRQRFIHSIAQVPQWRLAFAADGLVAARLALAQGVPDALLVDLGLPDGSGLELIETVAQQSPQCHILVISVFGDDDKVFRCIEAGASGYIIKGQGDDELAAHLEDLFTGGSPVSPRIARRLLQAVRQQRIGSEAPVAITSKPAELTLQIEEARARVLGKSFDLLAKQLLEVEDFKPMPIRFGKGTLATKKR